MTRFAPIELPVYVCGRCGILRALPGNPCPLCGEPTIAPAGLLTLQQYVTPPP